MNVVDSSGWLEYFADSPRAEAFAPAIEDTSNLIVPVVSLYEVFKKVRRVRGEPLALRCAAQMQLGQVVPLDTELALEAAALDLPLADSLIYATARRFAATLWTQDADFAHLPGVRYLPR